MNAHTAELVKSQIAKSAEKLDAARMLLNQNFRDDAISRAYYSMFHAASASLLAEGITAESHSALKSLFGLHLVKTGKVAREFGRMLTNVKDARENGDYDIFTDFTKADAQQAIDNAEAFLAEMKRLLRDSHGVDFP